MPIPHASTGATGADMSRTNSSTPAKPKIFHRDAMKFPTCAVRCTRASLGLTLAVFTPAIAHAGPPEDVLLMVGLVLWPSHLGVLVVCTAVAKPGTRILWFLATLIGYQLSFYGLLLSGAAVIQILGISGSHFEAGFLATVLGNVAVWVGGSLALRRRRGGVHSLTTHCD